MVDIIEDRRNHLKAYIQGAIREGFGGEFFCPTDGQFSEFDFILIKDYCQELGIELLYDGKESFKFKPYTPKKVEEEDWAKEFQSPKPNWFKLWINKLLYWINR